MSKFCVKEIQPFSVLVNDIVVRIPENYNSDTDCQTETISRICLIPDDTDISLKQNILFNGTFGTAYITFKKYGQSVSITDIDSKSLRKIAKLFLDFSDNLEDYQKRKIILK